MRSRGAKNIWLQRHTVRPQPTRHAKLIRRLLRWGVRSASCRTATRSTGTSVRSYGHGTSASARSPTATCSRRSPPGAPRSSPTTSSVTEHGIRLTSGRELEADIIVTATGLELLAFGGIELVVDGETVELPDTLAYKGLMLSGVPNFAFAVGYTNSSWTLKVDLVADWLCRADRVHGPSPVRSASRSTPIRRCRHGRCSISRPDTSSAPSHDFPKQGTGPWTIKMSLPRRRARSPRRGDHRRRAPVPGRPGVDRRCHRRCSASAGGRGPGAGRRGRVARGEAPC